MLGPDVDLSSETGSLFLADVVREMTQKTGQKCTAVRRILVPSERVEEVTADLVAELGRTAVGDPSDKTNRMGPLTDTAQLEDVRGGIGRLAARAKIALGGADPIQETGCFVAPTLLVAEDPRDPAFHAEEVFGPVATILPYNGEAAEAVEIVNMGGGGLVTSVYANDADWLYEYVVGVAPWHGRVWTASDRVAEQTLPPGMVIPASIHGGPGRAGGGEELGAERGLEFYMQRVAIQGFKGFVQTRFGADEKA